MKINCFMSSLFRNAAPCGVVVDTEVSVIYRSHPQEPSSPKSHSWKAKTSITLRRKLEIPNN